MSFIPFEEEVLKISLRKNHVYNSPRSTPVVIYFSRVSPTTQNHVYSSPRSTPVVIYFSRVWPTPENHVYNSPRSTPVVIYFSRVHLTPHSLHPPFSFPCVQCFATPPCTSHLRFERTQLSQPPMLHL